MESKIADYEQEELLGPLNGTCAWGLVSSIRATSKLDHHLVLRVDKVSGVELVGSRTYVIHEYPGMGLVNMSLLGQMLSGNPE